MGLARALAVGLSGIDGQVVEVECDISAGLPGLSFTGRPDPSVVESRDRLRAAVQNSGAGWPNRKITVALLPADVRKIGARFDLAIGLAVLAADGQLPPAAVADVAALAELGLTGALRPVRGVLPSMVAARERGVRRVLVARADAAEAALVDGLDVRVADHLTDVVAWLRGEGPPLEHAVPAAGPPDPSGPAPDLADVAGQHTAKHALELAAAGGHHLYLVGAPGAGKTMLAERLPGLLPPLDDAQALEVTAVHSIAGMLGAGTLLRRPPLQAPHHTASIAALVGGGSYLARPGAISLAHRGVLFLDEAPEFAPAALDALRQPLESGHVVLHRGGGAVRYPARFQLVLAANPCACATGPGRCECSAPVLRRHQQRLSGPLMDRIDLRVDVEPVDRLAFLDAVEQRETTATVAERVAAARRRAATRWADRGYATNAEVPGSVLRGRELLPPVRVLRPAEDMLAEGRLSARGFDRVLRIAWTLADLADVAVPGEAQVAQALFFRTGHVGRWAA